MIKPDAFNAIREQMVQQQLWQRGIVDERLLRAFRRVARHYFVPESQQGFAYEDCPLPIGYGQTISQPYIVALMTDLLSVHQTDTVLEVGTGSGYQAAILACLAATVYSVEYCQELAEIAQQKLQELGYHVQVSVGDGSKGLADYAPYDRIIVTAAAPAISPCWIEQLSVGGRIVAPVGGLLGQELVLVEKHDDGKIVETRHGGCRFVPLRGEYGF